MEGTLQEKMIVAPEADVIDARLGEDQLGELKVEVANRDRRRLLRRSAADGHDLVLRLGVYDLEFEEAVWADSGGRGVNPKARVTGREFFRRDAVEESHQGGLLAACFRIHGVTDD